MGYIGAGISRFNTADELTVTGSATFTTADNTTQLTLTSTDDDAAAGPIMEFNRNSASAADNDLLGRLNFIGKNDAGEDVEYGFIRYKIADASDGSEDGDIAIKRMMAGTSSNMLNFKETETIFNEDSKDIDFRVESDGNANMLFVDAGNDRVGIGVAPERDLHVKGASGDPVHFKLEGDPADYARIMFDDGTDENIGEIRYDFGSDFMQFTANAAERMRLLSDGKLVLGGTAHDYSGNFGIQIDASGSDNANIIFRTASDSETFIVGADQSLDAGVLNVLSNDPMVFKTNDTERLRIQSDGRMTKGTTSAIQGEDISHQYNSNNGPGLMMNSTDTQGTTHTQVIFRRNGANVGSIQTNGASTAYNTSSDYRLKEAVTPITNATDRLKQLNPVRFNFIVDPDTTVDGFLAHEAQAVVPESVSGSKDAMCEEQYEVTPAVFDDDGNEVTPAEMGTRNVPDYQGIDQSKLVPLLVATIQELEARIATLEAGE